MAETHQKSFPGVPVVFCFPSAPSGADLSLDSGFTGVQGDISAARTVDAALRLLPDTKHVTVVGGIAPYDQQLEAAIKNQLKSYETRLNVSYLTELTLPDLLRRLHELPSHSIVLMSALGRDPAGTTLTSAELGPLIVGASNAPVFSMNDRHFDHGEVGGDISSAMEQGKLAAGLAVRLLKGERGLTPVKDASVYMFDWQALRRWGLDERNLPPGSIVKNRQPGFWEQYRRYALIALIVLLSQMAVILALLMERARRRRTEADLRRSEEKFSTSFRQSPLAIMIVSAKTGCYIEVNESFECQTGCDRREVLGRTVRDIDLWMPPQDGSLSMDQLLAAGSLASGEMPFKRKDGQMRTALLSVERIEVNGESCVLCVIADITERKRAEEALSSVSRRLIEAQESERVRIGRELHDDVNQRVAIIAVRLKTLARELPPSESRTLRTLDQISTDVTGLAAEIQALSHRLHSSKLEYLGLSAASEAFCRELSKQYEVNVQFQSDELPDNLPNEISLCLFRVLQEALQNAVKHSGVRDFDVSLSNRSGDVELVVHDSGVGFDFNAARLGIGLGLTSMRERLRLVDGRFTVRSKSQQGTTVVAHVPVASKTVAN
ncbi:sensor histidine kinase [Occallatibacter riparius]|uniref:PAS domain S-box protein n=1 Tax=Occallatibacter riparius TaxID=1002689 RepID=A0A9J7BXV5_9BACT|nr:PAS domain S-box protein [Occallatibacter riparius]UWZ86842.1 PAS domain S-box protein [Occallatibacter riparius]